MIDYTFYENELELFNVTYFPTEVQTQKEFKTALRVKTGTKIYYEKQFLLWEKP